MERYSPLWSSRNRKGLFSPSSIIIFGKLFILLTLYLVFLCSIRVSFSFHYFHIDFTYLFKLCCKSQCTVIKIVLFLFGAHFFLLITFKREVFFIYFYLFFFMFIDLIGAYIFQILGNISSEKFLFTRFLQNLNFSY